MAVINEILNLADLLKYEEDCLNYSRKEVTVAAGQNLGLGTVVGRKSAGGKLHALDPAATDGTEVAVGVLIETIDATLIDNASFIVARHAIVADRVLIWPAGINAAQKAAAIDQLEARGILVYQGA